MESVNENGKKIFKSMLKLQKTRGKLSRDATGRVIKGIVKKTRDEPPA